MLRCVAVLVSEVAAARHLVSGHATLAVAPGRFAALRARAAITSTAGQAGPCGRSGRTPADVQKKAHGTGCRIRRANRAGDGVTGSAHAAARVQRRPSMPPVQVVFHGVGVVSGVRPLFGAS